MSHDRDRRFTLAHALDSKLRVAILRCLSERESGERKMCVSELADALDWNSKVVSYHVQVLHECGAIRFADDPATPEEASTPAFYVSNVTAPWALELLAWDEEQ